MRIVRVEKNEFELEDGSVFPINPPLDSELSPEEFQVHYERACNIIRSIEAIGSDKRDSSTVGRKREAENN